MPEKLSMEDLSPCCIGRLLEAEAFLPLPEANIRNHGTMGQFNSVLWDGAFIGLRARVYTGLARLRLARVLGDGR